MEREACERSSLARFEIDRFMSLEIDRFFATNGSGFLEPERI
jgi:hypothetical protein